MQLKKVTGSLAAAACSLLGASATTPSIAAENTKKWEFDTAALYYGESDRVTDTSLRFRAGRSFRKAGDWLFSLSIDTLSGASGSGALPANVAQTFTRPSGLGSYVVQAGETPLDVSFLDTRIALTAGWSTSVGKTWRTNLGLSYSDEYDYTHIGLNGGIRRDFNGRNTSLNLGLGLASDSIEPVGGVPLPLAPMLPEDDVLAGLPGPAPPASKILGDEDKTVVDLLVGVTQVLGRRTIAQFNYSMSRADGYLSDPYKLISVVDGTTGDPVPYLANINLYRFDTRPDERLKHSLFTQVRHHLGRDFIDGSYRFMTDDWGIASHTVDLRYRWKWRDKAYWQPHLRYYMQEAADFYVYSLTDGASLPSHASADYRLGEFDAYTLGLKYGRHLEGRREWSVRVEYYNQSGDGSPPEAIGSQTAFDLYPTVDAFIVQGGFNF